MNTGKSLLSRGISAIEGSVHNLTDFRWLWSSQTISAIGDQVFPIAATVSVLNAGGTAADLGLVLGARWLAVVLFALVGGVWADRLPRRMVMMVADLFRAAAIGVVVIYPGNMPVPALAALVFAVGAGEAFFRPAESALLPQLVPSERLPAANGLVSISSRSAAVIGPGIGGLLVAGFGQIHLAYAVNSLTFLLSFVCLFFVHEPPRQDQPQTEPFLRELGDGLREVRSQPWLFACLIAGAFMLMTVIAPEEVLLPIIGRREFGDDSVFAASLAAFALGGILGAIFAIRFKPRHPGQTAWMLGLAFGLIPLALIFPVSRWLIIGAYFIAGAAWEPWAIWWNSAVQRGVPPDRLARVTSVDWMATFALMPLGLALTGPLVARVGETTVLIGVICCLLTISFTVLRVPGVRDFRLPSD